MGAPFRAVVISMLLSIWASSVFAGDAPAGCSCDLETYQRETQAIRRLLSEVTTGNADETQAALKSWGVNPCRVTTSENVSRYAFDFGSENKNKCHDKCLDRPWAVSSRTIGVCAVTQVSFCGRKAPVDPDHPIADRCTSHGTDLKACEADPACHPLIVPTAKRESCNASNGRVWQDGRCFSNTCTQINRCDADERASCATNCNDCQMLTIAAVRHRDYKCFDAEVLESYMIDGNRARKARFGTAGTHSYVRLKPRPGSIAELISPFGFAVDSWGDVQFRRITSMTTDPGDAHSVDRTRLTFTPENLDRTEIPAELMPAVVGLTGTGPLRLSSGCEVSRPSPPLDTQFWIRSASVGLHAFYADLQHGSCSGSEPGSRRREDALRAVTQTVSQYAESMTAK